MPAADSSARIGSHTPLEPFALPHLGAVAEPHEEELHDDGDVQDADHDADRHDECRLMVRNPAVRIMRPRAARRCPRGGEPGRRTPRAGTA